jgi:phospholipase C
MRHTVKHVFVLMMENRSFDHMLGFSNLQGTKIDGASAICEGLLEKTLFNLVPGSRIPEFASTPADLKMPAPFEDPPHEFDHVVTQLCGISAVYNRRANKYPPINNSGFAATYEKVGRGNGGSIMRCYDKVQLPVLNALASEFAVCDHWFSSMPGPTWPNRFFAHASSSGRLDDSPSKFKQVTSTLIAGYGFENGTIFDRLDQNGLNWEIVGCDQLMFLQSLALRGMTRNWLKGRFSGFDNFAKRVNEPGYKPVYVFIEPNWGHILPFTGSDFTCGNSQHPLDDVTRGEWLIKTVYEAIRRSPLWNNSALIITYDEHGGFYDHVPPPVAASPEDKSLDDDNNRNGFDFRQLGVRVPAIVISPWIRRGTIDDTNYDHSAIPALIARLFGLQTLTKRDAAASDLRKLFALRDPRDDAPEVLPEPAESDFLCKEDSQEAYEQHMRISEGIDPQKSISPTTGGFLHVALLKRLIMTGGDRQMRNIHEFIGRGLRTPLSVDDLMNMHNEIQRTTIDDFIRIDTEIEARKYIYETRMMLRPALL